MAKTSMTTLTLAINDQQAKRVLESLKAQMESVKKTLAETQEKFRGERAWDAGDTAEKINKQIKELKKELKSLNSAYSQGMTQMNGIDEKLKNLSEASYNQLTKDRTTLTNTLKGLKKDSQENLKAYEETAERLQKIRDEIAKRDIDVKGGMTKQRAEEVLSDTDSYSIDQLQKAVSVMQQINRQQKENTEEWKTSNKLLNDGTEALNRRLKESQKGYMSLKDALMKTSNLKSFKGSIEDLEKLKKRLEEIRHKEISLDTKEAKDNIAEIDKAIGRVEESIASAKGGVEDFDKFIKEIDSKNLTELERAANQLETELKHTAKNTEDFVTKSAQLRKVGAAIDDIKKKMKEHGNVVEKTAKRLAAYVAVYGGFNAILGKMKEVINMNLQLSDSMADVQKTTGLTGVELQELGRSLERIDTRTATTELYSLAAAAGQIGLKTQEDVLGFAKAANTISVALNELGAEGSASLMKIATLTGEVGRYGTEQALVKVGSAINELTANSAATAGPIADFISRVGGIASASKIAVSEMAALGAAADASGQSIEIAGTSMNKFISALLSNTENIAYAANISYKELQGLIDQGETMQAVVRVLESMQNMDRGSMNELMKELGSEGARMNQFVASMVSNLDLLKQQLRISNEAFDEGVSVINEYNVKQESAMGVLQRMKNAFMDTFVNSKMTVVLKNILEFIADIPGWLEKNRLALFAVRLVIVEIIAMKIPFLISALMKNLSGMWALLSGPLISGVKALGSAWKLAATNLAAAGVATTGLIGKFRILWAVIAANPLTTFLAVATAIGTAIYTMAEQTDKLKKITDEVNEKHHRQTMELDALRDALESTNASYEVRFNAMKKINSLYSKYLGFELSELDVYGKKAKALDYINAKLKESQALELKNERIDMFRANFQENTEGTRKNIEEYLTKVPDITRTRWSEALAVINESIEAGITGGYEIEQQLNAYFNTNIFEALKGKAKTVRSWLEDYADEYSAYLRNVQGEEESFDRTNKRNQKKSTEELAAFNKEQLKKIQSLEAEENKKTEAEQVAHLKKLLKEKEEYLKTSQELVEAYKKQDLQFVEENTYDDRSVDTGNLSLKFGILARVHANQVNEQVRELERIEKEIKDATLKRREAESQLKMELDKKENEEKIKEAQFRVDELKQLEDELLAKQKSATDEYGERYNKMMQYTVSKNREKVTEMVSDTRRAIGEIQMAIEGDPFGKFLNLKSWKNFEKVINPDALKNTNAASIVGVYKKLREDYLKMSGDLEGLNKMFDFTVPMTSLDQAQDQIFDWAEQLRVELRRRGLTTTGIMIAPDTQSQVDNLMDKLKTHFIKRQGEFREAFINGSMTATEMNRRIAENDQELIRARVELRRMLMKEENNFMQELYPELEDVDLKKLIAAIGTADTEVRIELEKNLEEDTNVLLEGIQAARKKIEDELLANNPFTKLDYNFQESLDELQLMASKFEREQANILIATFKKEGKKFNSEKEMQQAAYKLMGLDEESQRKRLDLLMELSEKSYTVDAEGLQKMIISHEEYYNWIGNLDDKELQVMLARLQKFYDDALIAQENYAKRLIKASESSYDQQQLKLGELGKVNWVIDDLVKKRDNMRRQLLSSNSKLTKDQQRELKNQIDAANNAINEQEEKRNKLLDKLNKDKKTRDKTKEREAKEAMEASISALEAYYNEQEAVIRKKALETDASQATLDREIRKNTLAREKDMQELRKKLLGDESEFDPTKNQGYKGAVTGTVFFGTDKEKEEEKLRKQAEQIKIWGKALTDGMRNQIAKGEITIQEALQKQKDKIEKILLEDDFSAKVMHEYMEAIDELGLLFNIKEDLQETDKQLGEARLAYLQEWSKESYNLTAKDLQDKMEQEEIFSAWRQGRTAEDYEALLIQLRKFHDDQEEADRKSAERRKKIFDNRAEGRQLKEDAKKNIGKKENDAEMWDRFQGLDLVTEDTTDEAQIGIYQAKIDASRAYIEQLKLEMQAEIDRAKNNVLAQQATLQALEMMGVATEEQEGRLKQAQANLASLMNQMEMMIAGENENILENQQNITDRYTAMQQRKVEEYKKYSDAVVEWSDKMTEAEWDDVESRKEATKEMVKNLLSYLRDWAAAKLTEMAMKAMFSEQSTAIEGQETQKSLTMKGAEAGANVALSGVEGTGKEVAKHGLKGLLIGAAITAALTALMNVAMKALFKSKATVQSVSGAGSGRLATGMLTYKDGRYPTLGNDGVVYDAKYEGANMKTGIYRGGAHFGIFSEKKPEAIIDGDTTQRLIMNHPDIWKAIVTLSKTGRLEHGMRTFASGNIDQLAKQVEGLEASSATTGNADMIQMQATLERNSQVMAQLMQVLAGGIKANINMYGEDGMYKNMKKAEKFASVRKYK